jgi:putative phosphoesterase
MDPFIGVISDTHGLLRPEALEPLRGSELIIHAGDVGDGAILTALNEIAPVHAVRGNVDHGPLGDSLPEDAVVRWRDHFLYVLHILLEMDLDPAGAGFNAVIFGHSHKPEITHRGGVLYFNPGSAGPRRFALPVSVGRITLRETELEAEHMMLQVG